MKNLTLRGLRTFEAVATHSSFSRAAEALNVTQPAVSMQMRQLEEEIGVELISKQARPLVLTDAGRVLLAHTRAILGQVRAAEEGLAGLQGALHGQLRLGVVSTAHYFAPWLMTEFRSRHPDVRMKLLLEQREDILAMLAEHRLDMAITGYPPSEADVEAIAFARHPHCIVAAAGHPLARRRRIEWEELRSEPFVYREAGAATRQFLEHLLQSRSLRVNVTLELQGNETVKQAVMAGMGISFLSAHAFQTELAAGRMVVLDVVDMPKLLDWCLIHRRDTPPSGVYAAFRDFVVEHGARLTQCQVSSPAD